MNYIYDPYENLSSETKLVLYDSDHHMQFFAAKFTLFLKHFNLFHAIYIYFAFLHTFCVNHLKFLFFEIIGRTSWVHHCRNTLLTVIGNSFVIGNLYSNKRKCYLICILTAEYFFFSVSPDSLKKRKYLAPAKKK